MNEREKVRQGWKVSRQVLMWMLMISLIVSAVPILPAQSAAAAELPMQQTKVTTSSGFKDVSPTDWFYDAVVHVQEKGIFSGTNASSFSPKGTMTRAMYVTALGRMSGVDAGRTPLRALLMYRRAAGMRHMSNGRLRRELPMARGSEIFAGCYRISGANGDDDVAIF